jgi:hypothetical protein
MITAQAPLNMVNTPSFRQLEGSFDEPYFNGAIWHDNETGATITAQGVTLPFTTSFKRTMRVGQYVSILASLKGAAATSTIKGDILLDNKVVKTQTATGATAEVNVNYVIGE